jgi:hypothetical protein
MKVTFDVEDLKKALSSYLASKTTTSPAPEVEYVFIDGDDETITCGLKNSI